MVGDSALELLSAARTIEAGVRMSALVTGSGDCLDRVCAEFTQELADTMGAVVSCLRPGVDAKRLDKPRRAGTSGQTVQPIKNNMAKIRRSVHS